MVMELMEVQTGRERARYYVSRDGSLRKARGVLRRVDITDNFIVSRVSIAQA